MVVGTTRESERVADPRERIDLLLRDLRSTEEGLSEREAGRRLVVHGPNEIQRRTRTSVWAELTRQVTHPLALLLWAAAGLSALERNWVLAVAIAAVIVLNAALAFVQERHAERAVEALASYLPPHSTVMRNRRHRVIDVRELVPGDVIALEEGDRVPADARLLRGTVEVDSSMLTGESTPVVRSAELVDTGPLIEARDLVFSGTTVTSGGAHALVFATGSRTELGRIAALSERVRPVESPLEQQVRRAAYLVAAVAIVLGLAFIPLGWLVAGLSFEDSLAFAIGLLVANVPEGLLPTITLALALSVRLLARKGALVKRLSAVETLGATSVICTDKTGTLTENRMHVQLVWTASRPHADEPSETTDSSVRRALRVAATCSVAEPARGEDPARGDPMELAVMAAANLAGERMEPGERDTHRRRVLPFDSGRKRMSTIDEDDAGLWLAVKGAPEAVLGRTRFIEDGDAVRRLSDSDRRVVEHTIETLAHAGLRVLAVARRPLDPNEDLDATPEQLERELRLVGLIGLMDPPRPAVPAAVAACQTAGIRIIMVTGDHPVTAQAIARAVGLGRGPIHLVLGPDLDRMHEDELDRLLREPRDLIVARSSPETKLRIADSLRAEGHVVAMTGDGVNDAPALRRADIGVAMGRSGTDVAREAATMILTSDDFASVVAAVTAGRRVYDNVRRFIVYIFAHTPPEVVPFLVFALSGGSVPLPLTVLQILAIDLGTETLPALALGREPAEPDVMCRPPRARTQRVITRDMLMRAWVVLGMTSAALVLGGFFFVLVRAGWQPGDPVGPGSALELDYRRATTMTFVGIVACQIGSALAVRTRRGATSERGFGNPLLAWGIVFELVFTATLVFVPALQSLVGTTSLGPTELLLVAPFPAIVWGVDALTRRVVARRPGTPALRSSSRTPRSPPYARGGTRAGVAR